MIEPGERAFERTLANKNRNFPARGDSRSDGQAIFPSFAPGFRIAPGSSVFTIGACFARDVEAALRARGVDVPTTRFVAPQDEAPGAPNRVLNQYNPATMLQCVRSAGAPADEAGLYDAPGGEVIDPLLATKSRPVPLDRALARRGEINALYAKGLGASETVIVTLGHVETWFDTETDLTLNEPPLGRVLRAHPGRWEFRRLDVGTALEHTADLMDALEAGRRRIVLTVSPMPISVTYAGGDAVTANGYSKAVLRVVAEEVAARMPGVDYFPGYEAVTSAGVAGFGDDQISVRPALADAVVARMVEAYVGEPAPGAA